MGFVDFCCRALFTRADMMQSQPTNAVAVPSSNHAAAEAPGEDTNEFYGLFVSEGPAADKDEETKVGSCCLRGNHSDSTTD